MAPGLLVTKSSPPSGRLRKTPRARNNYDEVAAYESYMNPEPGFQPGPEDSVYAD